LPGAYPKRPVVDTVIRRNTLLRCGSNYAGQKRGAIWVLAGYTTISGTRFEENHIIDPLFRGIHLVGTHAQQITFQGNVIEAPGEDAIVIGNDARGGGEFIDNRVDHLAAGHRALVAGGEGYSVKQSGNSWQQ